ncbi:hypothetical protein CAF53_02390 [Sphingobium sp. LB126]|uniref:hypothetical protein n=1 Tax=Sphingobium sp. LB126 TaxID=1983755 RepID=UPI000C20AE8E|nr:hypothetical protein [Sphingobium sp. LB126]PJG47216.1 hypothetical protein CAF53_02390 [Sphingobium sp. LB126]
MTFAVRRSNHADARAERRPLRTLTGGALSVCLLVLTSPAPAQQQPDAEISKLRTQLVGSRPRTWIKERVVLSMGSKSDCTAGETYRFQADSNVQITQCIDHMLRTGKFSWTLKRTSPLDVEIIFGDGAYLLTFSGTERAPQMRWQLLGPSKGVPTKDIILGLSKD